MAKFGYIPERIRVWLGVFFVADVASLAAYSIPAVNGFLFPVCTVGLVCLLVRDRRWLLFAPLAELLWGSFGMQFSWDLGGVHLSLRLLVFSICVFWWLIAGGWKGVSAVWGRSPEGWLALVLLLVAAWGLIVGVNSDTPLRDVFLDGNAYAYLVYFFLWASVLKQDMNLLIRKLLLAAAVGLSVKTLVLFNIFANWYEILNVQYLYLWIRDTRVGEITRTGTAIWRIFIQSQLYIGIGLLQIFTQLLRRHRLPRADAAAMVLMIAALLVSLSRSYWVGFAAAILLLFIISKFAGITIAHFMRSTGIFIGAGCIALVLVMLLAFLPFGGRGLSQALGGRIMSFADPAGVSRLQLAGPLWEAIRGAPFLGKGFGSTVTYRSSDPRIKTPLNPEGLVTTYSFEWGYLDQWLKFGAVGLALFLAVVLWQFRIGMKLLKARTSQNTELLALLAGLFFIMIVHVFSPYLNHPLGLGYLLLTMVVLHHSYTHEASDHQSRHV